MQPAHGGHWLERQDVGGVTVVRVKTRRLRDDAATAEIFHTITQLVDAVGRRNLVLDLAAVEEIASVGLSKIIMLNRKTQAVQGRLALCGMFPVVAEVFQVAHLDEILAIYPGEQEAVQSFG
jgi:anti-anti-sigma factor